MQQEQVDENKHRADVEYSVKHGASWSTVSAEIKVSKQHDAERNVWHLKFTVKMSFKKQDKKKNKKRIRWEVVLL